MGDPNAVTRVERHHDQLVEVLRASFGPAPLVGVEIGTNAGDSARTMLERVRIARLYTIDPWRHQPEQPFEAGRDQDYHDEQETSARRKLEPYGGRVEILKMTSDAAFELLRGASSTDRVELDFVWIDGHHAEAQVRRDIEQYWSLVRPGGILGGHDYGLVPDVTRVVDAFMAGRTWSTGGDFTWWTQKTEVER